jgi:toxin-antitoxin system PIN domain toxin
MPPDPALVDTNVLVYAVFEDAPQNRASRKLLERCHHGEQPLVVTQQVLAEFYATVTNPKRVTSPVSPVGALALLRQVLAIANLAVLPTPPDLHERWMALLDANPVAGKKSFDVQLIATMLAGGVRRVFTYNTSDFRGFGPLEVMEP